MIILLIKFKIIIEKMFASENLLLNDYISTLEDIGGLKGIRWYPKEIIITDRALYLYKLKSETIKDHDVI